MLWGATRVSRPSVAGDRHLRKQVITVLTVTVSLHVTTPDVQETIVKGTTGQDWLHHLLLKNIVTISRR